MRNYEYTRQDMLMGVVHTRRGSPVMVNRLHAEADLKIVTGLVESHFMVGASGGRKSICPAIAGQETLRIFHGPEIIGSPHSTDLLLEGNPLQRRGRAGRPARGLRLRGQCHPGCAAQDHRCVRRRDQGLAPGGRAVLVARHTDLDPIGSPEYKQSLAMPKDKGPAGFVAAIRSPQGPTRGS